MTKLKTVAISTAILTTLTLTACSGGKKPTEDTTNDTATKSSQAVEQVLRRGNGAEPTGLDPQLSSDVPSGNIKRDLFEGLVTTDPAGKIVAGVAESWKVSEDGKTYTFKLRDTQWSDGTPLTAKDFVFAWQRGVNPKVGASSTFMLYPVKNAEAITKGEIKDLNKLGVKAIDDHTLEVTLKAPTHYFLGLLTHPITYPLPQKVIEKHGEDWAKQGNIVTNGAFTLADWTPQSKIELTKSKTYWGKDDVKLDKVIFYPTEDMNSEFKRFRAGEIDFTYNVPADQLSIIKDKYAKQYHTYDNLGTHYYGFNTTKAPFKDNLALRKALAYSIDREKLTKNVLGQGNTPAYGIVVPTVENVKPYVPEYAKLTQEQRNAKAKEFYKEAGYSAEKPLELELLYNTNETHKKVAIAIASMWKENLGVKVDLYNQEWKVYLDKRSSLDTQAFRAGWIGDYSDPNTFLDIWLPTSKINDIGFKSKKFSDLMAQASQEQDLAKRSELLHDAEKDLIDDFSVIPLYYFVTQHLISDKVQGFQPNVMNHHLSRHMYLADK